MKFYFEQQMLKKVIGGERVVLTYLNQDFIMYVISMFT